MPIEIFYFDGSQLSPDHTWEGMPAGWYYWHCLPGCLPDSDPIGPFKTPDAAQADASEQ